MIRRILLTSKKRLLSVERSLRLFYWDHFPAKVSGDFSQDAHLLIVKNIAYSRIAMTCALSYLHHHPKSRVILHCDNFTFEDMARLVASRKRRQSIIVLNEMDETSTWQYSKLKLILSLSGSNDIYMDADLRWNGVIEAPSMITFFVAEFQMFQMSPFRQALRHLDCTDNMDSLMKNTSFFSFAGANLSEDQKGEVFEFYLNLTENLKGADLGVLDMQPLIRLSEQIALSIFAENWTNEIGFLKLNDAHRDGAFVESSYFGATGSMF